MAQAQLLGLQKRLLRIQARLCRALQGEVLVDLLCAECAAGVQLACALGVACGLGQSGFCLRHTGANLRQIGLHGVGRKCGQYLAAFDDITHIHFHIVQSQTIGFGADAGLLPSGNAAAAADAHREAAALGLGDVDGQCGFDGCRCWRFAVIGRFGLQGQGKRADQGNGDSGCDQCGAVHLHGGAAVKEMCCEVNQRGS